MDSVMGETSKKNEYLEHNKDVYAVCAKVFENNKTIGIAIFKILQSSKENIIYIFLY